MRWCARRTLVGAAVVLAGVVGLNLTSSEAADPLPESDFKALVEQDTKNLPDLVKMGKKKTAANVSKASRAIKSNAMMVAYFANSRITGKGGAADAKMAALRDAAIKLALAGGKKQFDAADMLAKQVNLDIAAGKGEAKPMKTEDLAKAGEMDIEELMYQFKKAGVGGLGTEEDIKNNAKKVAMRAPDAAALAERVLAVGDYADHVTISMWDAKKTKKAWEGFNKDMKTAAGDLLKAAKGNNAKGMQTAFDKLDRSCTACHEVMK